MSDNFNGKDYGDYFRSLEQKLSNSEQNSLPKKDSAHFQKREKPEIHKNNKQIYKVIRLRPQVIITVFVLIAVIIFAVSFPIIKASGKKKTGETEALKVDSTVSSLEEETPKLTYNITENTVEIPASNDSVGALIVNTETHEIVAQRNSHERLYPASTTKIMTLLVACENIEDFEDTFTMTLDITDPLFVAEATVAGFLNGETITMTDMLYGLILPSGADAAIGLAIKISGTEEAFVELMNKRAKELGLNDTHFVNTSGLYDKNHYTSAYDMAIILEAAMQNPICRKILSTYQYTTKSTPQHPNGILLSATLFSYMYGTEPETATVMGGKTGFVNESGYCIASFGSNNTTGNEYVVVTLKNSSRWPAIHGQIDLYKQFVK